MGIPSYFSYIVKNHPSIIKKYVTNLLQVHNLYLDCNSIIYDSYSKIDMSQKLTEPIAVHIIQCVIAKIEEYIAVIRPTQTVFLAFDGVPPVAKLEQQRARRYKSWYQNEILNHLHQHETKKKEDAWNTSSITPGTRFMAELNARMYAHFQHNSNIRVSGSDQIAEGEHKLFSYIRQFPDKHQHETTVIYGLDADLIMLSLNHLPLCPQLYLFRETPHFIQSIDSSLEPDANYVLDIPELANAITHYMNNELTTTTTTVHHRHRTTLYDYIFLCFFLGNDFLPHFPAINIRTGGVDKMMNAYRATLGTEKQKQKENNAITDGKTIFWGNVRKVVQFLATQEEEFFIKEHKSRNYKEKYTYSMTTPEEKYKHFEATPTHDRAMEHYINPTKPGWQSRYYRGLFGIEATEEQKQQIALNYLQGLEWTMKYYTTDCPDWRWHYKYHYPPLLEDLIRHIPLYSTTEFVPNQPVNPVSEMVQLCYVLPRSSLYLLPAKLCMELIKKHNDWYQNNYEFVWAYCRYFWEAHVDMNLIDIDTLEQFVQEEKEKENKEKQKQKQGQGQKPTHPLVIGFP